MATGTIGQYRRWEGRATRGRWAWLAILRVGMRLANKDAQTRFLLWSGVTLIIGNCFLFYAIWMIEAYSGSEQAQAFVHFAKMLLRVDLSEVTRIGELRELLWRLVFLLMIKIQLFWLMITLSRVGPGLISDDIKTRALPIYFAKPVTPVSYIFGKWLVVATYVALVSLVPNMLSLLFGVLITGGLHTTGQTLGLAFDLVVAALGMSILAGAVMLALSCISADKRYVSVGWFAVCLLPTMAQAIINEEARDRQVVVVRPATVDRVVEDVFVDDSMEARLAGEDLSRRTHGLPTRWLGSLSLHGDVVIMVERLFGMSDLMAQVDLPMRVSPKHMLLSPVRPVYPATVLGLVTLGSFVFCYRRVVRFSRSAANV